MPEMPPPIKSLFLSESEAQFALATGVLLLENSPDILGGAYGQYTNYLVREPFSLVGMSQGHASVQSLIYTATLHLHYVWYDGRDTPPHLEFRQSVMPDVVKRPFELPDHLCRMRATAVRLVEDRVLFTIAGLMRPIIGGKPIYALEPGRGGNGVA